MSLRKQGFMEYLQRIRMSGRAWDALREWATENPGKVEITADAIVFDCDDSILECVQYMQRKGVM